MPRPWTDQDLWRQIDDRLAPEERSALERSLDEQPELRSQLDEAERLDAWLRHELKPLRAPEHLLAGVESATVGERSKGRAPRQRTWSARLHRSRAKGTNDDSSPPHLIVAFGLTAAALLALLFIGQARMLREPGRAGAREGLGEAWPALEAWLQRTERLFELPETSAPHELPPDLDLDHVYYVEGTGLVPLGPEGFAAVDAPLRARSGTSRPDTQLLEATLGRDGAWPGWTLRSLYSDGTHVELDIEGEPHASQETARAGASSRRFEIYTLRTADRVFLLDSIARSTRLTAFDSWTDVLEVWGRPEAFPRDRVDLPQGLTEIQLVISSVRWDPAPSETRSTESVPRLVVEHESFTPLSLAWVSSGQLQHRRATRLESSVERRGILVRALAWYRDDLRTAVLLQLERPNRRDHVELSDEDAHLDHEGQRLLEAGGRHHRRHVLDLVRDPNGMWVLDRLAAPSPSSLTALDIEHGLGRPPESLRLELDALELQVDALASDSPDTVDRAHMVFADLELPARSDVLCCGTWESMPSEAIQTVDLDLVLEESRLNVDRVIRVLQDSSGSADVLVVGWKVVEARPTHSLQRLTIGHLYTDGGWRIPWIDLRVGGDRRCGGLGEGRGLGTSSFGIAPDISQLELCAMKPVYRVTGPWQLDLGTASAERP